VQTNFDSVIGGYNPDQWEDTTGMKNEYDWSNYKDITSGSPFLFYWMRDEIQIIKDKEDGIAFMRSDKDWLMWFWNGLEIKAN